LELEFLFIGLNEGVAFWSSNFVLVSNNKVVELNLSRSKL